MATQINGGALDDGSVADAKLSPNGVRKSVGDAFIAAGNANGEALTAKTIATRAEGKADAAQATANAALPKSGGAMDGPITLKADATQPLQPVTKQQLDAAISNVTLPATSNGYGSRWVQSTMPPLTAMRDGDIWYQV